MEDYNKDEEIEKLTESLKHNKKSSFIDLDIKDSSMSTSLLTYNIFLAFRF